MSANSARRVADSNRMGRTPVARGSSVPACPTLCAPVSRRRRLTTVNEVSPAPLSTFRTPVEKPVASARLRGGNDRLLGCRKHQLHCLVHRLVDLSTRGADVAATAEDRAHRGGVDATPAAHADLCQVVLDFLEEDRE